MKEIADGVFIETEYDGVNVGAILTANGVVCIDVPSYPRDARDWVNRMERLHGRGPTYLIVTDYHGDRILNTRWLNAPIIAHRVVSERLSGYDKRYPQSLLDSLIQRNPVLGRELVNGRVDRASVSFDGAMSLHAGELVINLIGRPGPTPGSIWVYLPDSGILFAGDSVVSGTHPPLGEMCLGAWLDSLEELAREDQDVSLIVPGRGLPGGLNLVDPLRSYLEHFAAVVEQHLAAGQTREQLSSRVPEIAAQAPLFGRAPGWIDRQVLLGLQRTFDEFLATAKPTLVE